MKREISKAFNIEDGTVVVGNDGHSRLDCWLARRFPDFSRNAWQKNVRNGAIKLNGSPVRSPDTKIAPGNKIEVISFPAAEAKTTSPDPEDIPLEILYEDDDILAVDKPAGMVVHPGAGKETGTLVNAVLHKFRNLESFFPVEFSSDERSADADAKGFDEDRPGIVHRLDKDTSGVVIVAKNKTTLDRLQKMFKERQVQKTYLALVHGCPLKKTRKIELPLGRNPCNRKKIAVSPGGKLAVTRFEIIRQGFIDNQPVSVLQVWIETGRTHQIRVHLAHIHHPILGDKTYGGSRRLPHAPRQMLHAWNISFRHPSTGKTLDITSPLPQDISNLSDRIL
ncbi:MAG: RluA family pseudouridine synthase [Victivallales bacterium]|nr:RluA family pseudouridine synthase [Victivallales bacterium]